MVGHAGAGAAHLRLTEKTGIKNLEKWSASKRPVKLGSLGPGNATSALPQLLRAVLGLPINVVEGFKGTLIFVSPPRPERSTGHAGAGIRLK